MIHGYHSSMNEVPGKKGDDVLSKLRNVISSLVSQERYQDALEVNQWINDWKERDEMTPEDTAREVYLIARVHGVSSAEKYFMKLSDAMKDERTYSALLKVKP
ncbi:pentatricopeptide repeat-containing protein At1g02150-like [Olea europaea var. sylvestris]|uniref:pentatricopeptide repeat-containing protein At1g02150-like n=1 Tax=Olea europaea var. sylvestris TaxID=158386 RepID=UPI000C1D8016|nr:pentatricopeptide repeat-containing protein At1g02150-like [Olea europaea var. sylvestris]